MIKFLHLLVILIYLTSVHLQEVTYRLPSTVIPSHYELSLAFSRTVFSGTKTTFTGSAEIHCTVTETVSQIKLHSNPDYIQITDITFKKGPAVNNYIIDNITEILTISTISDLTPNVEYVLTITYEAHINTNDLVGVFRSSYIDGGDTKYIFAAQLQPTYARRVFPCFDEPTFKATFTITFTLVSNVAAFWNTELESSTAITTSIIQYTYRKTPIMSTYMLAFVISELSCDEALTVSEVENTVCSRPATSLLRTFAVEIAPELLDRMNQYTQINYSEVMNKLHYVALPNSAYESMDYWGLSTYREQYLLYDNSESTNVVKQKVAIAIAREIVQQWFGNLVNFDWWSQIYLNKGFADYLKYSILNSVVPDWQLQNQYVVDNVQIALRAEENYSPTMITNVSTTMDILLSLDDVTIKKAGSIFRMVEAIMGAENFKNGINRYLNTYAYGTSTWDKLWASLETNLDNTVSNIPSGVTLSAVMENWINESGFPLITVTVNGTKVTVTQKKLSNENTTTTEWFVPINYVTSLDTLSDHSKNPQYWLKPNDVLTFEIPKGIDWILINYHQTGYYRVNYDIKTWKSIKRALKSPEFGGIDEISRAQLVDDLFSLARHEILNYTIVFELLEFLSDDTSYFTWTAAFNGFEKLLNIIKSKSLADDIKNNILSLMSNLYQSTPFDSLEEDDHLFTLKRELSLKLACQLGHLECIGMSRALFLAYKLYSTEPPKELKSIVYCTALQQSEKEDDWLLLWNDYIKSDSDSERTVLLRALACTTNSTLLNKLLQQTLMKSAEIRAEDRFLVFESVASNPVGTAEAIDFFVNNYQDISEKYKGQNIISNILKTLAGMVKNDMELEKLKNLVTGDIFPTTLVKVVQGILTNIERSFSRVTSFQESLIEYFYPTKSAAVKINYNHVIFMIISILSLFV
ncbi:aminopeptidase N-like [Diorhabda sublineata]|uniref:aminopeptidase N-like n=1 Tax=Diorhabda sublineata TaxID=1163346 RepID=UPI0024E054E6|nr:aminopeptidase N-like [Diorhabda sublineata]XP_056642793.1 aminopeptidase N-like [Diorhabda sublineata]